MPGVRPAFDSDFVQLYHPRGMGQRRPLGLSIFLLAWVLVCVGGCERAPAASPTTAPAARQAAGPTVASLVPAASDILLEMGAGDHLVAISNYDPERPETADLPRVGDYRTIDWERLGQLRPDVMIVQYREDKKPPGLDERAKSLSLRIVNVWNNRLEDIFTTTQQLGEAAGEPQKAADAIESLRARLDAIRQRVAGRPPVRTLIASDASGLALAGGGTFIDDVLRVAGGVNVVPDGYNSYPTIDREKLIALDPQVVLQLLPDASPQVVEKAKQFWASVPQVSAVKNDRVHLLTEPDLLLPGLNVGRIAEQFSLLLHPPAKERP